MSAKAGTIQGTQTGVSWAGGRIAAILLIVVLALTLFAMTRGTVAKTPASTRFQVTEQLSGGKNVTGVTSRTLPGGQPIMVGSYACHQCR